MKFVINEYHHNVTDEEFINDMQSVAQAIGVASLTKREYNAHGKYSSSGIEKHFGSWTKACEKAGFVLTKKQKKTHLEESEIIADLLRVADLMNDMRLTVDKYNLFGDYHSATVIKYFGSWNCALKSAGLPITLNRDFSNADLFKDIEEMWSLLGRQPTTTDLKRGIGNYSLNVYRRRFGGWREAINAFCSYINSAEEIDLLSDPKEASKSKSVNLSIKHKTARDINLRLRFLVLSRDNFSCCSCGASPAKDGGKTQLHVDHIVPRSKGGETVMENLQTLCANCNLGKGNIEV